MVPPKKNDRIIDGRIMVPRQEIHSHQKTDVKIFVYWKRRTSVPAAVLSAAHNMVLTTAPTPRCAHPSRGGVVPPRRDRGGFDSVYAQAR